MGSRIPGEVVTGTAKNTMTHPVNETWLFQRLRWRLVHNGMRDLFHQSTVRMITILTCCAIIWGTLFAVSFLAFHELRIRWNMTLDENWITLVFNLSFVALSVLLAFSTGIILYSSLFASRETTFLLVGPVGADQIFVYKFQTALAYSSGAFLLLASPIMVAFGMEVRGGAPWYYFILLPLYFLGFVLLPGCVGGISCLLIVNFLPRRKKELFTILGIIAGIVVLWLVYSKLLVPARQILVSTDAFTRMLGEFSIFRSPFLPASWISEGIRAMALGDGNNALYYLALIWSNGLLLYLVNAWFASLLYRRGYNLLASGGNLTDPEFAVLHVSSPSTLTDKEALAKRSAEVNRRKKYGPGLLDHLLGVLLFFMDRQTRRLVLKDFISFRRDPAQWAQIVIFLGLAVLYFVNIRSFYQQEIGKPFQNGISLLNLTATSFLICAYTGRFVYPMLSLEGRKFWILGLLPLERQKILWGKFVFSSTGTLLTGEFLVLLSNSMLNVPYPLLIVHGVTVGMLALGLSAMSVGMGATMPNFRESDPSKIAVGFGGTLTLIMGLVFQIVVIGLMAFPSHMVMAFQNPEVNMNMYLTRPWMIVLFSVGFVFALVMTIWPLKLGSRALNKMEF